MIKAFLFDLDGTLSNRQKSMYDFVKCALKDLFKEEGMELEAKVQYYLVCDMYGFTSFDYTYEMFSRKYNLNKEAFQKHMEKYWPMVSQKTILLKEGNLEALKELKKRGYKLGIITSGHFDVQQRKIDTLGIRDLMDVIIVPTEAKMKKPNRGCFDLAASMLNLKNEECVYVGDNFANDIKAAKEADMTPIYIWQDDHKPLGVDCLRIKNLKDLLEIF